MKTITIGSWLPVFPGFYGTIFDDEGMYDQELELIMEQVKPVELAEAMVENFYMSKESTRCWNDYRDTITKQSVEIIEKELKELGVVDQIKFTELVSPKEYNFRNDSINVELVFTPENIQNIKNFIEEEYDQWERYLADRFSSRDGFISFHANHPEAEEWNIDSAIEDAYKAGAILDFICYEQAIDEETLYYGTEHYVTINFDALKKEALEKGWWSPEKVGIDKVKSWWYTWKNEYRFRIVGGAGGLTRQYIVETPKQRYIMAVSREEITNSTFIIKRLFKVFIFAKLAQEKVKK
jgi:hypothetical protein